LLGALVLPLWALAAQGLGSAHPLRISRLKTEDGREGPFLMENSCFNMRVRPGAGASVNLICTHDVHTLLKTHWYANHVAYGELFTDLVTVGDQTVDSASLAYRVVSARQSDDEIALTLASDTGALAPGLKVEKTFAMNEGESAFRLKQTFINVGKKPLSARFGVRYSADPERWSRHSYVRLFCGVGSVFKKVVSSCRDQGPTRNSVTIREGEAWFMSANSYGKAVTARFESAAAPLDIEITGIPTPAKRIISGVAVAGTAEITLQPGQSFSLRSAVLVADSMPGLGGVTADGLVFGADVPRFRPRRHPVSMYATAAYSAGTSLEAAFRRRPRASDKWTAIGRKMLDLSPGAAASTRVTTRFGATGPHVVSVVFMANGKPVASLERPIFIGDPRSVPKDAAALARTWALKMPEHRVAGSWKDIGRQMAGIKKSGLRKKALLGAREEWQAATPDTKKRAADATAFFRKHLPWYVEFLEGEAEALGVPFEQVLVARLPRPKTAGKKACIDFAVPQGPDGPLAAWSNEGYHLPESRCYYLHVNPRQGYTFHAMDGYGVNEKGLATGGASLNEHRADRKKCMAKVDQWTSAGKFTVPINTAYRGNIAWLLARCATVKEALAFLQNPEAPVSWTGNMLLVDRSGAAAVFQSCGFCHVIRRPGDGLLACTNYPGQRSRDGGFSHAGSGGQYFNGILRERTISRFMKSLNAKLSVDDAKALLRCRQEPGPVCQSKYDSPAVFITTTSFLANCRTSDLYLCWGNPWNTQFVMYELSGPGRAAVGSTPKQGSHGPPL